MVWGICVYMFDGERVCANDESPQILRGIISPAHGTQLWRGHPAIAPLSSRHQIKRGSLSKSSQNKKLPIIIQQTLMSLNLIRFSLAYPLQTYIL